MAAGEHKAMPISICLNMENFIDILITDSITSKKILEIAEKPE